MTVPAWIDPNAGRALVVPAEVKALNPPGKRSAAGYLATLAALLVMLAQRYARNAQGQTFCNIFAADGCDAMDSPLPHRFDDNGTGAHELRANDIVDDLRAGKFPGWHKLNDGLSASNLAACGVPVVVTWKNPQAGHSGHITFVVPTPAGKSGVYVWGAGWTNVEQKPLADSFGHYGTQVEYWGYER